MRRLRVALFPCAYNEVDGVANTMRHFEAYAHQHELPVLNIHGGFSSYHQQDGPIERFEFCRRWPKFRLDASHDFDLNFWRYFAEIERAVRDFRADIVHITGPSDVGQIGALVAHRLHIPLVASWHTNLHEYAQQRLMPFLPLPAGRTKQQLGAHVRHICLRLTARFYRIARSLFAPNQELIAQLERLTGKPCYLMSRGVDTDLFHPGQRNRADQQFVVGYVGRLTTEKNIRFLAKLERGLLERGLRDFRITIVGQGSELGWLRENLRHAEFLGVLRGEQLAAAYANFDVFAFPSHTDTFGNVVLEAMAAGVPAVVTNSGGPKYIVQHGESGFIAANDEEFIAHIAMFFKNRALSSQMSPPARRRAARSSWEEVFRHVYDVYEDTISQVRPARSLTPDWVEA